MKRSRKPTLTKLQKAKLRIEELEHQVAALIADRTETSKTLAHYVRESRKAL